MEIIIESPHFTINKLLKEYTEKKVSKLTHIDDRIIKCEVLLKLDKSGTDDNKVCEIIMNTRQTPMFA
jgi:ribosome-associated translation inhibitor RaiA